MYGSLLFEQDGEVNAEVKPTSRQNRQMNGASNFLNTNADQMCLH